MRLGLALGLAFWLVFALVLSGCATVLHPERRGQVCVDYDLDLLPAALDSSLLLLGLVPGAVALGVDATTGALWECEGSVRVGEPSVVAPW